MVLNPHHASRITSAPSPQPSKPQTTGKLGERTVSHPPSNSNITAKRETQKSSTLHNFYASDDEGEIDSDPTENLSHANGDKSDGDDFEIISDTASQNLRTDTPSSKNKPITQRTVELGTIPPEAKVKNATFTKTRLSHIIEAITSWLRGLNRSFQIKGSLIEALFPQTRSSKTDQPKFTHTPFSPFPQPNQIKNCSDRELADKLNLKDASTQPITNLFPAEGISLVDIQQGHGRQDCYFLSALASILAQKNGAELLQSLIREIEPPSKQVIVKFPNSEHYITVDKTRLIDAKGNSIYSTGAGWVTILEKAFHAHQILEATKAEQKQELNDKPSANIDRLALHMGTDVFLTPGSAILNNDQKTSSTEDFKENLQVTANAFQSGNIKAMTLGTSNDITSHIKAISYGLMPGHAYAVLDVVAPKADNQSSQNNSAEPHFIIYNPYGAHIEAPKNQKPTEDSTKLAIQIDNASPASGIFIMSLSEVSEYFNASSYIPKDNFPS